MKLTITTKDVNFLTGKFIIQVNSNEPDYTITEKNWEFVKEKRLSFVCGLNIMGFYYVHQTFKTEEEFVEYFNNYVFTGVCADKYNGERFHRLLTSKEIDFVCKKMKESNY
jgi:hypothetical protein